MNATFNIRSGAKLAMAVAILVMSANTSYGQLQNRYSFTTDASDSIGGQDGTLFGTNGSFTGGQLVLDNNGEGSTTPGVEGAYLDLPNGLISSAATAGSTGAVTIEMWITMLEHRDWAAAFSAGISELGENATSGNNGEQPYIQIIPRTGDAVAGNDFRATSNSTGAGEGFVDDLGGDDGTDLQVGRREHIVTVYDQSAGTPGTITVYRNGSLMGTADISANLDLTTFLRGDMTGGDVNNWVGRSQWPDSLIDAAFDELRVYGDAVTEAEALSGTIFGPDVVGENPIPSIEVDKDTGTITLKNNASAPINLEYYSIASDGGALLTSGWNSLDDQNYNAADGSDPGSTAGDSDGEGWDAAGGSDAQELVELFLGESGSILAANDTLELGSAYNTSIFGAADGDLVFQLGITGGAVITASVEYVGVAAGLSGDFNNDGVVDAADYTVWRANLGAADESSLNGNGNGTNGVDEADFALWRSNYGSTSGGSSIASVPEPMSGLLVLFPLVAMFITGRKR